MCEHVSFKCVYKGILAEGNKRPEGFTYYEMRDLVPHNNSAQFSRQFWYLVNNQQSIFCMGHVEGRNGAVFMTAQHAAPKLNDMLEKEKKEHEKTSKQLEFARNKIAELEAKLGQISSVIKAA
jgi:hypothetical protein